MAHFFVKYWRLAEKSDWKDYCWLEEVGCVAAGWFEVSVLVALLSDQQKSLWPPDVSQTCLLYSPRCLTITGFGEATRLGERTHSFFAQGILVANLVVFFLFAFFGVFGCLVAGWSDGHWLLDSSKWAVWQHGDVARRSPYGTTVIALLVYLAISFYLLFSILLIFFLRICNMYEHAAGEQEGDLLKQWSAAGIACKVNAYVVGAFLGMVMLGVVVSRLFVTVHLLKTSKT